MKNIVIDWRDLNNFPKSKGGWGVFPSSMSEIASSEEVEKKSKKWSASSGELYSSPQTDRFLPPQCLPELSKSLLFQYVAKIRFTYLFLALVLLISIVTTIMSENSLSIDMIAIDVLLVILVFYFFRECTYLKEGTEYFTEKSLFTYYSIRRIKFFIFVSIGATLLFVFQIYIGIDQEKHFAISEYGMLYGKIFSGEYWRLLIGPFFHSSLAHFLTNIAMLFFSSLYLTNGRFWENVITFFFASVLSGLAVYTHSYIFQFGLKFAGFSGMSGGIFFVIGVSFVMLHRHKEWYPINLSKTYSLLVLILLVVPYVEDENSSTVCHIFGLVLGLAFGYFRNYNPVMYRCRSVVAL
ncbi:MAG: hypothetical protein ACI89U_000407 [Gammaproteobacteria bacterium]|jgi:hypothetical protein